MDGAHVTKSLFAGNVARRARRSVRSENALRCLARVGSIGGGYRKLDPTRRSGHGPAEWAPNEHRAGER